MRRRRRDRQSPSLGNMGDPAGLAVLGERFLMWGEARGYSPQTQKTRRYSLARFFAWCRERGVSRPAEVSRGVLERYQRHLFGWRKRDGKPLSSNSQVGHLNAVRAYFKWLARQNYLLYNPAAELELPRIRKSLPREVLSVEEAEALLSEPDLSKPVGVRDRTILETLYSTGVRRGELVGLELGDVDLAGDLLMVRKGKSRRDRLLPLGRRASSWLDRYIHLVRPGWVSPYGTRAVFVTVEGLPMRPKHLGSRIGAYVRQALGKAGACHLLRHTMATQMLRGGADIRYIQQMLGHEQLESTKLYTHLSVEQLRKVHAATHPAEREWGAGRRGRAEVPAGNLVELQAWLD